MNRIIILAPLLTVVVLLSLPPSILGLHLNSARERPCFNISQTVPVDLNWLTTIGTFYYPAMSRLELYRTAGDLLCQDPKCIMESSVYYDSCITWNIFSNGSMITRGFDGRSKHYGVIPVPVSGGGFRFGPADGTGYSGTLYSTLTDNKTFIFQPFCMDDGEMTWGLGSPFPSLPAETMKLVYDHAESLGFNREYFTELKYDQCNVQPRRLRM